MRTNIAAKYYSHRIETSYKETEIELKFSCRYEDYPASYWAWKNNGLLI